MSNRDFLTALAIGIFFVAYLYFVTRRVRCPRCLDRLSAFPRSSKRTWRQLLVGDRVCRKCGYELDNFGRKIPFGTAGPLVPPIALISLAIALMFVAALRLLQAIG